MRLRCPACNRPILSRRNARCGFCQEPLSTELIFSPEEVEAIEAEEKERALTRKLRDEERARQIAAIRDLGGGGL
ncbi:hypothetical protein P12x_005883 [Tundrisphaera lichenicola]|uniref:hypothetical protein n=1 Tax=Tundrisphaera lichenicola TaxID=2029860 RepID=UPI003EB78023